MNTEKSEAFPVVERLEILEDDIYNAYGVESKPAGDTWVMMVLDIAKGILKKPGLSDAITEGDLNQLTEDNYHTARHAAEVIRHLKKYTL